MPRPRRPRRVRFNPNVTFFKPRGIPLRGMDIVVLSKEELEAIRLVDYESLNQTDASKKMEVSQPTFHRILNQARKKISKAMIEGSAIEIQ